MSEDRPPRQTFTAWMPTASTRATSGVVPSPPASPHGDWAASARQSSASSLRSSPRRRLAHRGFSASTYAAFLCFGLSSWIMTNTTFVELSYFMLHSPEKLSIFAYAMFALQSANIYPILYMWLNPHHKRLSLVNAVWICLAIATAVSIGMSCLWHRTAIVFGAEHSVALLVLTHFGGLVSAVTSVIFFPYVATFPPIYTSALSTGEGLSGTLVGLLGLLQQPYAAKMAFSVSTFYLACVVIVVASVIAFAFLEFHPKATAEREKINSPTGSTRERNKVHSYEATYVDEAQTHIQPSTCSLRQRVFDWFGRELACQAVLALLFYGVLPSVSSFLFARYSPDDLNRAAKHQTIASTAIFFVDPIGRFATGFFRLYTVYLSTIFLVVVGVLLLVCTLLKEPPGSSQDTGFLLPLVLYIASSGVYSYTQTMLMLSVKQQADCTRDRTFAEAAYQWSGFAIQMGAFVGTIVIFPLTLLYSIFERSCGFEVTYSSMRNLTLFPTRESNEEASAELSSNYVSLSDLPMPLAHLVPPSIGPNMKRVERDSTLIAHDLHDTLTPTESKHLRHIEDTGLLLIVGTMLVLAWWGYVQAYSGELCSFTGSDESNCTSFDTGLHTSQGSPDLRVHGQSAHIVASFQGGWPLANTLLHLIVPMLLLICIVFTRMTSSFVTQHSAVWLWCTGAELVVLLNDAIILRRWKQTTCLELAVSITAYQRRHSGGQDTTPSCEYTAYDAFIGLEAVLVVELSILVLLQPLILRLYGSLSKPKSIPPIVPALVQDGDNTRSVRYRRL